MKNISKNLEDLEDSWTTLQIFREVSLKARNFVAVSSLGFGIMFLVLKGFQRLFSSRLSEILKIFKDLQRKVDMRWLPIGSI